MKILHFPVCVCQVMSCLAMIVFILEYEKKTLNILRLSSATIPIGTLWWHLPHNPPAVRSGRLPRGAPALQDRSPDAGPRVPAAARLQRAQLAAAAGDSGVHYIDGSKVLIRYQLNIISGLILPSYKVLYLFI